MNPCDVSPWDILGWLLVAIVGVPFTMVVGAIVIAIGAAIGGGVRGRLYRRRRKADPAARRAGR